MDQDKGSQKTLLNTWPRLNTLTSYLPSVHSSFWAILWVATGTAVKSLRVKNDRKCKEIKKDNLCLLDMLCSISERPLECIPLVSHFPWKPAAASITLRRYNKRLMDEVDFGSQGLIMSHFPAPPNRWDIYSRKPGGNFCQHTQREINRLSTSNLWTWAEEGDGQILVYFSSEIFTFFFLHILLLWWQCQCVYYIDASCLTLPQSNTCPLMPYAWSTVYKEVFWGDVATTASI